MATFNYIRAVWRNGVGVVSDAPGWALEAVERALPDWLAADHAERVGVQREPQSGLCLRVFVSPSASGSRRLLEDAAEGSFVHVVATDGADAEIDPDEARRVFETSYGTSLSEAALRQQRSFMLLEFPYHQALATDLFVGKDMLEEPSGAPDAVGGGGSADSLATSTLRATTDGSGSGDADGLPFDQGLSYEEVVRSLADRAIDQARTAPETIPRLVSKSALEAPEPRPGATGRVGADLDPLAQDDARDRTGADDELSLSALVGRPATGPAAPTSDGLPFDQGLPYDEVVAQLAEAVMGRPPTELERQLSQVGAPAGDSIDARRGVSLPALFRWRSGGEGLSPLHAAAGLLLFVFGVLGVIALLPAHEPVREAAFAAEEVAPDRVATAPTPVAAEPAEETSDPASAPIAAVPQVAPGIERAPLETAQPVVESPDEVGVPAAVEVAAVVPVKSVRPELSDDSPTDRRDRPAPESVPDRLPQPATATAVSATPVLVPVGEAVASEAAPAEAEIFASPEPVEEASVATSEPSRGEPERLPSSRAIDERAPARGDAAGVVAEAAPRDPFDGVPPAVSAGAESVEVEERDGEREKKPEVERRRRERKRLMQQIQRYR